MTSLTRAIDLKYVSKKEPAMTGMHKLLKQAAKIQEQIRSVQQSLARQQVEATTGGGAVRVVASCDERIISIEIAPELLRPEEQQMLQELILTAVNLALEKARETAKGELSKLTAGLPIPGLNL